MSPTNLPLDHQCSYSKLIQEMCQPPETPRSKSSLLPFLGDALKQLTGRATTRDI